jgi:hypothetical protein
MFVKMHGPPINAWKPDHHSADDQRVKKRMLEDNEETTTKQAVWKLL